MSARISASGRWSSTAACRHRWWCWNCPACSRRSAGRSPSTRGSCGCRRASGTAPPSPSWAVATAGSRWPSPDGRPARAFRVWTSTRAPSSVRPDQSLLAGHRPTAATGTASRSARGCSSGCSSMCRTFWLIADERSIALDRVIACIPQVLDPDLNLADAIVPESESDQFLHALSNYCGKQGYVEDQFGLGLVARALEESVESLVPGGKVIFNLGGRPGRAVLQRLFRRRGFEVREIWQMRVEQAADTAIEALVGIENRTQHRFEFFLDPQVDEPVSARTAHAFARAGGRIYHALSVHEAELAHPSQTRRIFQWLHASPQHESVLGSVDLTFDDPPCAEEKTAFLASFAEQLSRLRFFPLRRHPRAHRPSAPISPSTCGSTSPCRWAPQDLLVAPSRIDVLANVLSLYRPQVALVEQDLLRSAPGRPATAAGGRDPRVPAPGRPGLRPDAGPAPAVGGHRPVRFRERDPGLVPPAGRHRRQDPHPPHGRPVGAAGSGQRAARTGCVQDPGDEAASPPRRPDVRPGTQSRLPRPRDLFRLGRRRRAAGPADPRRGADLQPHALDHPAVLPADRGRPSLLPGERSVAPAAWPPTRAHDRPAAGRPPGLPALELADPVKAAFAHPALRVDELPLDAAAHRPARLRRKRPGHARVREGGAVRGVRPAELLPVGAGPARRAGHLAVAAAGAGHAPGGHLLDRVRRGPAVLGHRRQLRAGETPPVLSAGQLRLLRRLGAVPRRRPALDSHAGGGRVPGARVRPARCPGRRRARVRCCS